MAELTLEITSKCNLNCWWCSANAGPDGVHCRIDWVLKQLSDNAGKYDTVRISGGEPTLHPEIDVIIKFAKEKYKYKTVVLLTNGERYYEHPGIDEYYISCADRTDDIAAEKPREETLRDVIGEHGRKKHHVVVTGVLCPLGGTETALRWGVNGFSPHRPVHLYRLVRQGRASEANYDISITGDNGCEANCGNKKTITHDGKEIPCSCQKEGNNCPVDRS